MIRKKYFFAIIIVMFAKVGFGIETPFQEKLKVPLSFYNVFQFPQKLLNCDQDDLSFSAYQETEKEIYTLLGWDKDENIMKSEITDACWARKELKNNDLFSKTYLELKDTIFQKKVEGVYSSLTSRSNISLDYIKPLQDLCDIFEQEVIPF